MRRMYSQHAPFENFWQQTHITPKEEFDINWNGEAEKIRTKEEILHHLSRNPGWHHELLEQFYSQSDAVLALGAGNGIREIDFLTKFPHKRIILSDISIGFLKRLSEQFNVDVCEIDARKIGLPDNHFDFVYALAAEYFFNDDELFRMVSEMARVTKPGKHFLISTAALDSHKKDWKRKLTHRLICYTPPSMWVKFNELVLRRKLKLTGYVRTLEDFLRIFQSKVRDAVLNAIHFDYNHNEEVKSAAFVFTKNSVPNEF